MNIDKDVAIELLPIVNDPSTWEALTKYVDWRIESLRSELEQINDDKTRGAIQELRHFKSLQKSVQAVTSKKTT